MSIKVGRFDFEGPFTTTDELHDKSGIYVILSYKNGQYFPIDVGESSTVKSRVGTHDRSDCWQRHRDGGTLCVAIYYVEGAQQQGRMQIEQELRKQYMWPCGKQ